MQASESGPSSARLRHSSNASHTQTSPPSRTLINCTHTHTHTHSCLPPPPPPPPPRRHRNSQHTHSSTRMSSPIHRNSWKLAHALLISILLHSPPQHTKKPLPQTLTTQQHTYSLTPHTNTPHTALHKCLPPPLYHDLLLLLLYHILLQTFHLLFPVVVVVHVQPHIFPPFVNAVSTPLVLPLTQRIQSSNTACGRR